MSWIVCTRGSDRGLSVEITKEAYTMGRAPDCDLQIVEERASRYHCKIFEYRNKLYVEDLGSTNGIKYKGKRFKGKKLKLKEKEGFGIGADYFEYTAKHDAYIEAAEDLVSGYGKKSQRSIVEQTYSDAINKKDQKKKTGLAGLFSSLFGRKD